MGEALLGGRVRYRQPEQGFRSGIEPVLLAASIPARPGERVLEGGTGAGAALLCLAARVAGVGGVGIERDAGMAALAGDNLRANGFDTIVVRTGDLTLMDRADLGPAGFDHAFANPPYHAGGGTKSPDAAREGAKRASPDLLAAWIGALAAALRPRGTLTLILPAGLVGAALAAAAAGGCGSPALFPLWPRAGRPAKLVLLRWLRGGRAPFRVLPGLVLHDEGGFAPVAEGVLRRGEMIAL